MLLGGVDSSEGFYFKKKKKRRVLQGPGRPHEFPLSVFLLFMAFFNSRYSYVMKFYLLWAEIKKKFFTDWKAEF